MGSRTCKHEPTYLCLENTEPTTRISVDGILANYRSLKRARVLGSLHQHGLMQGGGR